MGDTNRISIGYGAEGTWGSSPGSLTALRWTNQSFNPTKETIQSNEVRSDGQISDLAQVGGGAGGGFEFELSHESYDTFLQAALRADFTTVTLGSGIAITFTNPGTIGCALIDTAVEVGDFIKVFGATNSVNNGIHRVTALGTDSITVDTVLNTETPAVDAIRITHKKLSGPGTDLKSITLERNHEDLANTFFLYTGMIVSGMTVNFASKSIVTGNFSFLGKNMVTAATSTDEDGYDPATVTEVLNCAANVGRVYEAGVQLSGIYFQSMSIQINNASRARDAIGYDSAIDAKHGSFQVTGNIKAYLHGTGLVDKFVNNTASQVALFAIDNAGGGYVFDMPRIKYSQADIETGGLNSDTEQSLGYQALRDPDTGKTMRIFSFPATAPA